MKEIKGITICALLVFSLMFTMNYANAIDNNCQTSIWTILELTPILGCIEERLDALENQTSSGGETTECINLGTQYQIITSSSGGDCFVRSLANGTGITMTTNSTHIIINSTSSGGETTVCSNIGSFGQGIVSSSAGGNCDFKRILNGTGISLTANSTNIIITNSAPDNTICANVGTGKVIYKDGECNFKTLVGSADISITNTTDTVVIDYNGTLVSDKQVGQVVTQTYLSLTKTNIGSAYSNVYYTTAFDEEHLSSISFTNATYFKIIWIWDYVGTGNQQCKWIDASGNILYETTVFAIDRDGIDSGWLPIPVGMNEPSLIRWQCKSTVAGDDPIAKGYKIMVK